VVDEFIILTGFRDVKISNGDIYLNGKRFILKGISRHEDHPKYGNSLTYEEMEKDIVLIKISAQMQFASGIIPLILMF
jgi:beta-galactosidase/beta-glucuronidase